MKKLFFSILVLVIFFSLSGTSLGQELFSEDWETGIIDPLKWGVGGNPTPVIFSGGHDSNYALNHNGDGWCHSAAHTQAWFNTAEGLVAEFWLKAYECAGCEWSSMRGGFTEKELTDNQYCAGENWYDGIAYVILNSKEEIIGYRVTGNDGYTESYPDTDWHKYKIEIRPDGIVLMYRDDQLKYTSVTPLNLATFDVTKFQQWGQAAYGPMLIDDMKITGYDDDEFNLDLKVNGSDGKVIITPTQNVSVTLSLSAEEFEELPVEWWVGALTTSFGNYWFNSAGQWTKTMTPYKQGPLEDLPETNILNLNLPLGVYNFFTLIETNMDGEFNPVTNLSAEDDVRVYSKQSP